MSIDRKFFPKDTTLTAPRDEHEPTHCTKQNRSRYISGGGRGVGHTDAFRCSVCGREGRYLLNYLSGWTVVCNGRKFTKVRMSRY